jgi:hypothetical protein
MRDSTKFVIGLGSIWGLFAFGVLLVGSFTIGTNDSTPEIVAILLYGLTILPSCILAIWFLKYATTWLILLVPISAFGFVYQLIQHRSSGEGYAALARSIVFSLIIAAIPGLIGILLRRSASRSQLI